MSVTLVDIALRTNLNKGTVSRILNDKGASCSPETRQRVLTTAAEMGYQPNMLARALQTGRSHTVALWLISHAHYSPYFGTLQHHLQRIAKQHRYHMITETASWHSEDTGGTKPLSWPVDGVISLYMTSAALRSLHASVKMDCPMVYLQQTERNQGALRPNTDYVFLDVDAGARQAVEHLLDSGCSRIAFVGERYVCETDVRAHVYRELLNGAGQKTEFVITSGGTRRSAFEGVTAHLEQFGCPDGFFCPNDELAIGCYLALQKKGIRIPDDAMVVGFDGLENAELFPCPISSVVIPMEEMCAFAWETLQNRIDSPGGGTQQRVFTPRLDVRESSKR